MRNISQRLKIRGWIGRGDTPLFKKFRSNTLRPDIQSNEGRCAALTW